MASGPSGVLSAVNTVAALLLLSAVEWCGTTHTVVISWSMRH